MIAVSRPSSSTKLILSHQASIFYAIVWDMSIKPWTLYKSMIKHTTQQSYTMIEGLKSERVLIRAKIEFIDWYTGWSIKNATSYFHLSEAYTNDMFG